MPGTAFRARKLGWRCIFVNGPEPAIATPTRNPGQHPGHGLLGRSARPGPAVRGRPHAPGSASSMHTALGWDAAALKFGDSRIAASTVAGSIGENPSFAPKKSAAVFVSR